MKISELKHRGSGYTLEPAVQNNGFCSAEEKRSIFPFFRFLSKSSYSEVELEYIKFDEIPSRFHIFVNNDGTLSSKIITIFEEALRLQNLGEGNSFYEYAHTGDPEAGT